MIKLFPSPSGSIRIHYCMYMHLQSCILYVYICCSSVLATVPVFASWLDSCRHQRGKEKKTPQIIKQIYLRKEFIGAVKKL